MALTQQQLNDLRIHWGAVIQGVYPAIDEIPKGDGDSLESLLSTWRDPVYSVPTEAEIVIALDAVLAGIANETAPPTIEELQAQIEQLQAAIAELMGGV